MAVNGHIGSAGGRISLASPVSLGVSAPSGQYPNGTITFSDIKAGGCYWRNNNDAPLSMDVYICDSAGNNAAKIFTLTINGQSTNTTTRSGTLSGATGLAGKALYLKATGAGKNDIKLYNATAVAINTSTASHTITCTATTGGSLTANRNSATPGQTVTLTPTAAAGYSFTGYTVLSGGVSISGNTFTMGSSNVQIRANFSLTSYAITKAVNPAGAGTVSTKVSGSEVSAATMGTSVTVTQEAASGYYFDGWTTRVDDEPGGPDQQRGIHHAGERGDGDGELQEAQHGDDGKHGDRRRDGAADDCGGGSGIQPQVETGLRNRDGV